MKEGEKGEWRVVGGVGGTEGGSREAMGSLFRPRVFARANKTRSDGSCSVKLILFLSFFFFLVFWFFGFSSSVVSLGKISTIGFGSI